MSISQEHTIVTIDQFTKQAIPFAQIPGHSSALDLLVDLAQPNVRDDVLDVACGPGLVACHFAIRVRSVTGIDMTPAMISEALKRSNEQGIENAKWQIGSATSLPFGDSLFDLVVSRYAFHHLQDPLLGMKEMIRVCKPGGRVLVADVALPADKVDAYDKLELIRDPSHTHALSRHEFAELFQNEEFNQVALSEYKVDIELEEQINASFPMEGGAKKIREIVSGDLNANRLGINARKEGGKIYYSVPICVGVGIKQ
jgi:SAM-dependent methyltransferase